MRLKKILFINPFGIGDVIFTTPLIREIKENYPAIGVGYWCNERVSELLRSNPRVDKVFALSRGDLKKIFQESTLKGINQSLKMLYQIKKERFEAAFDFSLDQRYGLACLALGIKKRVGYNYKNRGRFLTDKIALAGFREKHIVQYYLELLRFFDIKPKTDNLEIYTSENNEIKCKNILIHSGIKDSDLLVGLAPGAGASWGEEAPAKHWPAVKYAKLADKIIEEFGAKILILGDTREKPIAEVITATMKNKPVDLTGRLSLGEFVSAVKRLKLLISNDGGPLHVAVASGIKTVSIFGPVDDIVYGPYPRSNQHTVIKDAINCRPCYKNFKMDFCDKNRQCLNNIAAGTVFKAVKEKLDNLTGS